MYRFAKSCPEQQILVLFSDLLGCKCGFAKMHHGQCCLKKKFRLVHHWFREENVSRQNFHYFAKNSKTTQKWYIIYKTTRIRNSKRSWMTTPHLTSAPSTKTTYMGPLISYLFSFYKVSTSICWLRRLPGHFVSFSKGFHWVYFHIGFAYYVVLPRGIWFCQLQSNRYIPLIRENEDKESLDKRHYNFWLHTTLFQKRDYKEYRNRIYKIMKREQEENSFLLMN